MGRSATHNAVNGAIIFLVAGLLVLGGAYVYRTMLQTERQIASSDAAAAKGRIRIGVDNFIGYFPLCSTELRDRLLAAGYGLDCVEDDADYRDRFERLADGELDYAVTTLDAYLSNGAAAGFPGVIVAVLDESAGADAIVAREAVVPNLDALKATEGVRVAFTPDSPSHFLLKAIAVHFDVPFLRARSRNWRVEAAGSSDALALFTAGTVDVAVLWEPDVSKALAEDGVVRILGSEDTRALIVDVLLAGRAVEAAGGEPTRALLTAYFETLAAFEADRKAFAAALAAYADVSRDQARLLLDGVSWKSLGDNATAWMGAPLPGAAPRFGLYEAISRTVDVLVEVGEFGQSPLPSQDPRRIISSGPIVGLFTGGGAPPPALATRPDAAAVRDFEPLSDDAWDRLRDVGTLQVRPIAFEAGAATLTITGKQQIDEAAKALQSYPNFRVVIAGHTNPRGDEAANRALSAERARAVARYLEVTHGLDPDALRPVGYGSAEPLARGEDEAFRAYMDRLSRVELRLVAERR